MKIKLIGLDLDGTVLTRQKNITEETSTAIQRALSLGITVVPVTGRPLYGLPEELLHIPGLRYAIVSNGAATIELSTQACLESHTLSNNICQEILQLTCGMDLIFEAFVQGYGYENPHSYETLFRHFSGTPLQSYIERSRRQIPSMKQFLESCHDDIDGLSLMFQSTDDLAYIRHTLINRPDLSISHPSALDLEVNHLLANKGRALLSLGARLGISASETMAIGDSGNDISLLKHVGFPVAMGNATDEIKALSTFVTADNEHNGVASAINCFVLNT